jgi:hypothetical protein
MGFGLFAHHQLKLVANTMPRFLFAKQSVITAFFAYMRRNEITTEETP